MKRYILILVLTIMCLLPGFRTQAADSKDESGTYNYEYAFEVLELVNDEREKEGVAPLSMDESLLDSAMARAAEIRVKFSHERPNGETCFSINNKMFGENIAYGQSSPSEVMKSWMNSKGHRENIMNSSYKSIGVGCLVCKKGIYWVQCFGFDEAIDVACPKNEDVTYEVPVDNSKPEKVAGFKTGSNKKTITVKWKNDQRVDGYELQISQNKKFKDSETYFFENRINKLNINCLKGKKLKSHKKYYVRVRSIVINDQGIDFSKWKRKTIKVK